MGSASRSPANYPVSSCTLLRASQREMDALSYHPNCFNSWPFDLFVRQRQGARTTFVCRSHFLRQYETTPYCYCRELGALRRYINSRHRFQSTSPGSLDEEIHRDLLPPNNHTATG